MKINYLAVLACVVMHAVLGMVWYGMIFAGPWMAMNGITDANMQGGHGISYFYSIVQSIIMALFIGWLIVRIGTNSAMVGMRLALIVGVSTIGVALVTNYSFSGRPMRLAIIDALYPIVSLAIMGAILGAWKTKSSKAA